MSGPASGTPFADFAAAVSEILARHIDAERGSIGAEAARRIDQACATMAAAKVAILGLSRPPGATVVEFEQVQTRIGSIERQLLECYVPYAAGRKGPTRTCVAGPDSMVQTLELELRRMVDRYEPKQTIDGGKKKKPKPNRNDPRDKFCYESIKNGKPLAWIKLQVEAREHWGFLDKPQGVSQAARRYAIRHSLPWPLNSN